MLVTCRDWLGRHFSWEVLGPSAEIMATLVAVEHSPLAVLLAVKPLGFGMEFQPRAKIAMAVGIHKSQALASWPRLCFCPYT